MARSVIADLFHALDAGEGPTLHHALALQKGAWATERDPAALLGVAAYLMPREQVARAAVDVAALLVPLGGRTGDPRPRYALGLLRSWAHHQAPREAVADARDQLYKLGDEIERRLMDDDAVGSMSAAKLAALTRLQYANTIAVDALDVALDALPGAAHSAVRLADGVADEYGLLGETRGELRARMADIIRRHIPDIPVEVAVGQTSGRR